MATTRAKKLTDQLRAAIENCGMSRHEIARQTGLDQSAMSDFVLPRRGLSLASVDVLGEFLGLELRRRVDGPEVSKG